MTENQIIIEIKGPSLLYSYETLNNLEYNSNEVNLEAQTSNLSFYYSGRHDHGQLKNLNENGYYKKLISSLYEIKKECDKFIKNEVTKQNQNNTNKNEGEEEGDNNNDGDDDDDLMEQEQQNEEEDKEDNNEGNTTSNNRRNNNKKNNNSNNNSHKKSTPKKRQRDE